MDSREVIGSRVVNIVEKRNLMSRQGLDYDTGFQDDQWYDGPQNYQDARDFHDGSYTHNDRFSGRYYDENPNFGFHRNSSPPRNEGLYAEQNYSRDDLRHQLDSRNNGRPDPHFHNRDQGLGRPRRQKLDKKNKGDHDIFRNSLPVVISRDRSPGRRGAHPPALGHSGSNMSTRSFSPNKDKGYSYQQAQQRHKANVSARHTPTSSPVDGSPHSSVSSKEKTPASAVESEEAAAASMEPKPTPEEDANTRRLEAIKSKALDIEKHYRQDCETFHTVVKMLVAKEPSLDKLLQAPLEENLSEMKQRCLDALRHFVKELDGVSEQPNTSENTTGHKTQEL